MNRLNLLELIKNTSNFFFELINIISPKFPSENSYDDNKYLKYLDHEFIFAEIIAGFLKIEKQLLLKYPKEIFLKLR